MRHSFAILGLSILLASTTAACAGDSTTVQGKPGSEQQVELTDRSSGSGNIGEDAHQAAKAVGEGTHDALKAVGHGARETTKAIGHGTRDFFHGIGNGLKEGWEKAKEEE